MRAFTVVLPAGWERIDFTGDVDQALSDFRRRVMSRAPRGRDGQLGRALGSEWSAHLKELAGSGAYCLITSLDVGLFLGQPTLVVTPLTVPDGQTPMDLLIDIASTDSTATLFDIDKLVALRTISDSERTNEMVRAMTDADDGAAAGAEGLTVTQRMHRYFLGDPADPGSWAIVSGTTTVMMHGEDSRELLDTYTDLLDDVVGSFRWVS